ncbi:MAG: hypothetical protein V4577_02410 [Bacteroidota bacterium]
MDKLRKKLFTKEFNSFNDQFDPVKAAEFAIEIQGNNPDRSLKIIKLGLTYFSLYPFNEIYRSNYPYFRSIILKSGLTNDQVVSFQIAAVNRDYMLMARKLADQSNRKKEFKLGDAYGHQIKSIDPEIGSVDTTAVMELAISSLHVTLGLLKHYTTPSDSEVTIDELFAVNQMIYLQLATANYALIKEVYDDAIWNEGYIVPDPTLKRYRVIFENPAQLILYRIGFYRLERQSINYYLIATENSDYVDIINKLLERVKPPLKKELVISSVSVENGFITYKLDIGTDEKEAFWERYFKSEFLAFYEFNMHVQLQGLENISLLDLVALFSVTHCLFKKAAALSTNTGIQSLKEFGKFPHRIKYAVLCQYLEKRTNCSIKLIHLYLDLLINPENQRVNFWKHPFVKTGDDLLFALLPICSPRILYIVDEWLERGGYDIALRGKALETHIKETLSRTLKQRGFNFHICPVADLRVNTQLHQEIDLLVNLKDVVIVAEVKCIKYPMEARDTHNARKRLKEGAVQIIKKTQFLKDHAGALEKWTGDIAGKELIPLVITNYPLFSGEAFDGIPVIDFLLLDAYVVSGGLTDMKVNIRTGHFDDKPTNETLFYHNETDFGANLKKYMTKPPAIELLKSSFEIQQIKITTDPEFYLVAETAIYK